MRTSLATLAALSTLTISSSVYAAPQQDAEQRKVESAEFQFDKSFKSPKRMPLPDKQLLLGQKSAAVTDWSTKNQALQERAIEPTQRRSFDAIANNDFWIYDSWATLSNDLDYDGYYSKLTVEFDADTIYNRAYVYAIIYLGVGDVFDSIHVTSVFAIDADSSNDSFIVESNLISGFPSNDYEILIELYDADTDQFVAFSDGLDDADLAIAPLESENYEILPEPTVVIVEEHGGSLGFLGLFAGLLVALRRKFR